MAMVVWDEMTQNPSLAFLGSNKAPWMRRDSNTSLNSKDIEWATVV